MEAGGSQGTQMTRVLSLLLHDVYDRDPSESGFRGPAADRYKLTAAEFDGQLRGLAEARSDRPILVTDLPPTDSHHVPFAITVDDGGVSYYTMAAALLEARGWRGHCFVTTGFIGQRGFLDKRQIREIHDRGHLIGTHSVSHPRRFGACGWDEMMREWGESRKALQDIVGGDVTAASVPGGYFSRHVAKAAHEAGLSLLFTSEPVTSVHVVDGCIVIGRFTVRRGCSADFGRKLALLDSSTVAREWIGWNTKKIARTLMGAAYSHLVDWGCRVDSWIASSRWRTRHPG